MTIDNLTPDTTRNSNFLIGTLIEPDMTADPDSGLDVQAF